MTAQPARAPGPAEFAAWDHAAIVDMIRELVRIPTRGGRDDYRPAVDLVTSHLAAAGLEPAVLTGAAGAPLAIAVTVGDAAGSHYVLDACLDTADTGDPDAWSRDPFSGEVTDGWLHGRGSADSKAAVAIFTDLAGRVAHEPLRGKLTVLFDLDEHAGGFGGIKAWLATQDVPPDGVMIGYPGPEKIVIGGRGVWRARITVHGQSAHSGSRHDNVNAITRAMGIDDRIAHWFPQEAVDVELGLPPKYTLTSITGGASGSYSVVPDVCTMEIDVRLTATHDAAWADQFVRRIAATCDTYHYEIRPTIVTPVGEPWPAYRLPADHPMVEALRDGASAAGLDPKPTVAGPSNIGCMLSQHGIPATAGFGVAYRGLHAADEAIDVATIPAVYVAYYEAVRRLLG